MKIKPIKDKLLIKYINQKKDINSNIIIPETMSEKPDQGIILEISTNLINSELKIGDHVLFNKYSGQNIKFKNQDLLLIKEEDILAIIINESNDN